jgi:hypothetical protein
MKKDIYRYRIKLRVDKAGKEWINPNHMIRTGKMSTGNVVIEE